MRTIALALGALCVVPTAPRAPTPSAAPVLQTMQTELARSLTALRAQPTPPYFLSYGITELHSIKLQAAFGAITDRNEDRERVLDVDVRVGDYAFDNTHAAGSGFPDFTDFMGFAGATPLSRRRGQTRARAGRRAPTRRRGRLVARLLARASRALHGAGRGPRARSGRVGREAAPLHRAVRAPRRRLRRQRHAHRHRRDPLVREQRRRRDPDVAAGVPAADHRVLQGRRRHGVAAVRVVLRDHRGQAPRRSGDPARRRPDDHRPAGAAPRACDGAVHRPRDSLRPGERCVLSRNPRASPGRSPPETRRRRPDVHPAGQRRYPPRWILRVLRSHALAARRDGARRLLSLR